MKDQSRGRYEAAALHTVSAGTSVILLSQNGSTSLQLPSAWQIILSGPLSLYPASHEKFVSLPNCTPFIVLVPFSKVGGGGDPHSTTTRKTCLTQ